jgi:hypothetical protein
MGVQQKWDTNVDYLVPPSGTILIVHLAFSWD